MQIENKDGLEFLQNIDDNSIDLVLTDPPYIISKSTGMDLHYNSIRDNTTFKNESEWLRYKSTHNIKSDEKKELYMKYGTIYGKKYAVQTNYGSWDVDFTMDILEKFIEQYYKKLKKGGTCIIFFDLWKMNSLKDLMEKYKFKQIRMIEWVKTNPQPLNSKINYLTNCREIALVGVKVSKPTFNSCYDNGIYMYPLQSGKNRFHPTQKSLKLFMDLISKHTNENDIVLDTFLGSGTTAIACQKTKRKFVGCEINEEYYKKCMCLINKNLL